MRSKAELMREHRARLADQGLVKVEAWVRPEDRDRLGRYVRQTLGGHCAAGSPAARRRSPTGER